MTRADGYVEGIAWPDRFQRELMPEWLRAVATALGHAAPDTGGGFRWLDLGCGGGLSALIAAACHPQAQFIGVDIDAAQIERASATARAAGLDNVHFLAADARELAGGDRLHGNFDFIVSHGVWSWVSPGVREALSTVVQARLSPGGLACIGYMSHPGAAQMQPIQRLMREAARQVEGDIADGLRAGLHLLGELADNDAGFFAEHPGARRQVRAMGEEAAGALAHEFLGEHFAPQHSADTIRAFARIGCDFLGSATPIENIDAFSIPTALQPMLRRLPAGPLAETVRDMARNQSLRRDLFQKESHRLSPDAHLAALDAIAFALLPDAPARSGGLRFDTRIGPVDGPAELFDPLLRALATQPCRFSQLRTLPVFAHQPGLLNQAMQVLLWAGIAHPLSTAPATPVRDETARSLPDWRLLPHCGTAIARPPDR